MSFSQLFTFLFFPVLIQHQKYFTASLFDAFLSHVLSNALHLL